MNAEKLHDALNYLDDGMILETDKLRHRKKKTVIFRRFISAAACVCLVAAAVFGIGHMRNIKDAPPFDENFEVSQNDAYTPPLPEYEASEPAPDESSPHNNDTIEESSPEEGIPPENPNESASAPEDAPAEAPPAESTAPVVLEVTEITENGFKGKVKEKCGIFEEGREITVVYDGDVNIKKGDTVNVYWDEYKENTVTAESVSVIKEK